MEFLPSAAHPNAAQQVYPFPYLFIGLLRGPLEQQMDLVPLRDEGSRFLLHTDVVWRNRCLKHHSDAQIDLPP